VTTTDRADAVALVTDGRMSGASGKVPAAIHLTPEAVGDGLISKLRDGDVLHLDAAAGTLEVAVEPSELAAREAAAPPATERGYGRELFAAMRAAAGPADKGASIFN